MSRHRGTESIRQAFAQARREGRAALITYMTLGYPSAEATPDIVRALAAGGADLIELGVPFSDPVADGPVIQRASHAALQAGMTPAASLEMVTALRARQVTQPLVLMGYYNPIYSYGVEAYAARCAEVGVDGLIVPDLPPEEGHALEAACAREGIALIYLIAPNTGAARTAMIAARTRGFLYLVSRLGTTGQGDLALEPLRAQLAAVAAVARTPVAVGFGVSTPEQAGALAAAGAEGIIVGSTIVERAAQGPEAVQRYTQGLRAAMQRTLAC